MSFDWQRLKARLSVGDAIQGTVIQHHQFGVFLDIGVGFLGLVEIMQFKEAPARMTREEFPPLGSTISANVIWFDDENMQLKLSLRPSDYR